MQTYYQINSTNGLIAYVLNNRRPIPALSKVARAFPNYSWRTPIKIISEKDILELKETKNLEEKSGVLFYRNKA
jgi:hypothetical protein